MSEELVLALSRAYLSGARRFDANADPLLQFHTARENQLALELNKTLLAVMHAILRIYRRFQRIADEEDIDRISKFIHGYDMAVWLLGIISNTDHMIPGKVPTRQDPTMRYLLTAEVHQHFEKTLRTMFRRKTSGITREGAVRKDDEVDNKINQLTAALSKIQRSINKPSARAADAAATPPRRC
jgi:hypothetical protein